MAGSLPVRGANLPGYGACAAGRCHGVPYRRPLSRRLTTIMRQPVGVGLTSWRYLWRLTPVDRWEWSDSLPGDAPPELPAGEHFQRPEDGTGPVVHRLYRVLVKGSEMDPMQLMTAIAADIDQVAPSEFATFEKVVGDEDGLQVGDEYVVRMPGPWNGPVRVVAARADAFRLATLDGHLEAGQIEFSARTRDEALEFTIESWACNGDRLSDMLYSHLRISKEVQLHMWVSVLERVVGFSGGMRYGPLEVMTRRDQESNGGGSLTGPVNFRARRGFAALEGRASNVDPDVVPTREEGWNVDDCARELPPESPGPPAPCGSWELARRLMIDYQVADPAMVRATYKSGTPLAGRDMLLQVRWMGLRFYVGVRVGDVYDETRVVDDREVRVFGWSYSTLQGHFEAGRQHYEVWKWLESGTVEFRLRAFSRATDEGPRLRRLGFRLVGRTNQLRFYRRAAHQIARLTEAQLVLKQPRA